MSPAASPLRTLRAHYARGELAYQVDADGQVVRMTKRRPPGVRPFSASRRASGSMSVVVLSIHCCIARERRCVTQSRVT